MQVLLDRMWKIKHSNAGDWSISPPHPHPIALIFWSALHFIDVRKSLPKAQNSFQMQNKPRNK